MKINEVAKITGLSKRAIKYYESKGLINVKKDNNGYRNYSEIQVEQLNKINTYRKLDIAINDIMQLMKSNDKDLLIKIVKDKKLSMQIAKDELKILQRLIDGENIDELSINLEYQTIGKAISEMMPGYLGYYFMNHFQPYLQIKITTTQQKVAYDNIIEFWDNVDIKMPLFLRVTGIIMYKFLPKQTIDSQIIVMDKKINDLLNPDPQLYQKMLLDFKKSIKLKNSFFCKYHPAFRSQRKFMKRLQDCGYNDIFISNMKILSPKYKIYHDALTSVNDRMCLDAGAYYDSDYNIVIK